MPGHDIALEAPQVGKLYEFIHALSWRHGEVHTGDVVMLVGAAENRLGTWQFDFLNTQGRVVTVYGTDLRRFYYNFKLVEKAKNDSGQTL